MAFENDKARKAFCDQMGWKIEKGEGTMMRILGADNRVLSERSGSLLQAYLDGLMDGFRGKPFEHSK